MPMNTNIDTTDLMRVERPPVPIALPVVDQPVKSPFYRGQVPNTAIVNPDAVRNFQTPGIPSYRVTPPQPLNLSGTTVNATPGPVTSTFQIIRPPAPTIAQTLTSIPTGYQFSFYEVRLPLDSRMAISVYKIYRNTTSDISGAVAIQTFPHNPATLSNPVVVQDNQTNGVTQFYWVSAVNTSGLESSLIPAQSGTITNNAGFDSNSRLASTLHNNPVNVATTPTSSTALSNTGSATLITIAATSSQFASGVIAYNTGTIDPTVFGTFFVFADDPLFAGGTVIYQFSTTPPNQTAAEGRLNFGKITTVSGTPKTGGGYSGGTTPGGTGGRGFIQQ